MRKRWHNLVHGSANDPASGKQNSQAVPAGSRSAQASDGHHKGRSTTRPVPPTSKRRSNSSSLFKRPAWPRFSCRLHGAPRVAMVERAPLPPPPTGLVTMTADLQQWRTDYVDPGYRTRADDAAPKSRKAQRAESMFRAMEEYTRQQEERKRYERQEKEAREREERINAIVEACRPKEIPPQFRASKPSEPLKAKSRRNSLFEDYIDSPHERRNTQRPSRVSRMPSGPKPIVTRPIERLPNPIEWDWRKQNHPRPSPQ